MSGNEKTAADRRAGLKVGPDGLVAPQHDATYGRRAKSRKPAFNVARQRVREAQKLGFISGLARITVEAVPLS